MKRTVKLVAEPGQGEALEREIATLEREDQVSPASSGPTIAEGKNIMEVLQRELVTAQMEQHGAAVQSCRQCGSAFRTKGYYQSTLRSVYGKVRASSADQGMLLFRITSANVFHVVYQQKSYYCGIALPDGD